MSPTLNEALAERGYTTRPTSRPGAKEILVGDRLVYQGTAPEIWLWLRHQDAKSIIEEDGFDEGVAEALLAVLCRDPLAPQLWEGLPSDIRLWVRTWLLDPDVDGEDDEDWDRSCLRALYELLEALP